MAGGRTGTDGVLIADRQNDVQIDARRYRVLVRQLLEAEGVPPGTETAVTFVGRDEMAELNKAHMGHAGPTDVLAFPLDLVPGPRTPAEASIRLAGDIVVCPAVAAVNAEAGKGSRPGHDGSVTAEIDLLVVHGVLHLLGMDHAEPAEAAAMRARETEHLRSLWSRS
ncbi:MAG: rRNA maturation RNase YbeY [Acidimicrobiaceae bacterium]|nr:rRNA maturation RNase YbeY [Acidimicrobiaceae bacterium]